MMRAAPLRYGAVVGLVAAPHSGLMTRLRVPAPLTCAGVAQLTNYQHRFASTANDTTQLTKTKPMLATKRSGPDSSKELEVLKSKIQAEAKKRGTPKWLLSMAKDKDPVAKTAGKNPKVVTFDDYSASLEAKPSILGDFNFVPQLQSIPVGLSSLAVRIRTHVGNLRRTLKTHPVKGYTAALVIQNAPGVGKTFGSVAVAGILNRKANEDQKTDYYLPLYIGLGDVFPITQVEIDLLRDQSQQTHNEYRVRAVIGRRLLLQLMFISDKLADGNLKLWDVVESEEHRGFHLTPVPPESTFSSHMEFPLFDDKAMARCAELIQQLSEYCDGRKLVVLLIIDEGQMLDQLIEPQYGLEQCGAQLALLFGRELQLSCTNKTKDTVLLPIMTGSNPTTWSVGNQGHNSLYSEPLNTLDEFVDIALSLDQERDDADAQKRNRRLAALFYPVARDVKSVYDAAKSKCFGEIFPEKLTLAPSTAQLLVMARGTETYLYVSKWDTHVPAIFSHAHFLPVPSFYHLSNYLCHFSWLKQSLKGKKRTFAVSEQCPLAGQDHSEFELAAIDILSVIMALTNMPGKPETSIAAEYDRMRTDWLKENKWFDLTRKTDVCLNPMPLYKSRESQNQRYLPSSSCATDAFLVTPSGQNAHPLHPGTRAKLGGLTKQGELFSMVCGGSSPVDFIFVLMKTSRVKDTDPCEVELRLADAKRTATGNVAKVEEMLINFSLVSKYLRVALKKECNMTVTGEKYAIVTNQKDAGQSMLDGCNSKLKDIVAKTHVLSPATLKFPPFTTRLFE